MAFAIEATPAAASAIHELRGTTRRRWLQVRAELEAQGCKAAGYRLLAPDGGRSELCCRHLDRDWRLITTFEPGVVVVVAIGRHDGSGFYSALAEDLDIRPVGQGREQKPPCC